jgi:hypothetical protein
MDMKTKTKMLPLLQEASPKSEKKKEESKGGIFFLTKTIKTLLAYSHPHFS